MAGGEVGGGDGGEATDAGGVEVGGVGEGDGRGEGSEDVADAGRDAVVEDLGGCELIRDVLGEAVHELHLGGEVVGEPGLHEVGVPERDALHDEPAL